MMGSGSPSNIIVDNSGDLRSDVFYAVSNLDYRYAGEIDIPSPMGNKEAVILRPKTGGSKMDWLWADLGPPIPTSRRELLCQGNMRHPHLKRPFVRSIEGDLFGGPEIADFVFDNSCGRLLVTLALAKRLRASKLKGYILNPFTILVNQSRVANVELFLFQAVGENCERPMKPRDVPNQCPLCQRGPLVCGSCGYLWHSCPECEQQMYVTALGHGGSDDHRLIMDSLDDRGGILEGARWDGTDFIESHQATYFSKRAFDWLASLHVGPLIGVPARFCVDGMDDSQRAAYNKVRDVATVEP